MCGLAAEEVFGFLEEDVAAYVGDGVGEGYLLGADFYAVLREAALLHAAVAGEGAEPLLFKDRAGGVIVEELDLSDGGCADETRVLIELRADLHAAGAGDAVGERVVDFLILREDARAGAEVVGAVDGNPGFDALEIFEEDGAVDLEIADQRKF
jgi:hypothetical protein